MDIAEMAQSLRRARADRIPIGPLSETYGLADPRVAYDIQAHNTQYEEQMGRRVVGCKIGLTSPAVQKQLGVDEPDFGVLWGDQGYRDGDQISSGQYIQPRVEAEIAFVMKHGIEDPNTDLESLAAGIDYAVAAIEIVDSAVADWRIALVDTIADNASAAGFVLGEDPQPLAAIDLIDATMAMSKNGSQVSEGIAHACMGNPLNATLWLARTMVDVGQPLQVGDIVLSGALGPMVDVAAGDKFEVQIQGFKSLSVEFVE